MAIDFNKQLVFDPKIEIVGKEVPLAAMEKTSNVLQDRYDKSYEQYSLADEALKQMEASANAVDRQKAKELRELYNQELQGILQKGDFHNMRQQTAALARNAAVNYKTIAERNQKIQSDLDALAKDPRYRLDPEGAKKEYLSKIGAININPETRTISDFTVTPYNAAADVSIAEKLLKIAPTIRTKTTGNEDARFVQQMFNGQPIWTKVSTSGKTEVLSADEINNELSAYIKTDPEVQAYVARDVGRMGLDVNTKEGQQAYNQLLNERISGSTKALGNMYSVDNKVYGTNRDVIGGAKALGIGDNNKLSMGVPVNTLANAYGNIEGNLRENLVKGLTGQKGSLNAIMNFVNSKVANLPEDKQPKNYKEFKQVLNEVKNLTPEQQAALAPTFESVFKPGVTIAAASASVNLLKDPKLRSIQDKLLKNVGTYFSFDTEAENEFDNYVKENQAFQNINLLTPSYQDAESINKMQTWMDKSLAPNDFKSFKGEIDPKASYSLSKVSDRPVGNGTGIVIEFKNNKDNSTILVEPKDERMLYALESNFPGIVAANMFKNTSDFNAGEIRPISEIFKENNPSGKKENLFPKGYPEVLKTGKIFYKDGMFMLLDNKGNPLQGQNGQPIMSTSYLDLIQ